MEAKSHGDIRGMDPYASAPENVIYSGQEEITKVPSERLLHQELFINPNLRLREEEFGAIVVSRKGKPTLINHDALKLISILRGENPFFLRDIEKRFGLKREQCLNLFSYFAEYGIIGANERSIFQERG